jgi:hypothetical protein
MNRAQFHLTLAAALALAGCADPDTASVPDTAAVPETGAVPGTAPVPDTAPVPGTAPIAWPGPDDPFGPIPDTSEGLTNTSTSLLAVHEYGTLGRACDAYRADPTSRTKRLRCGKAMFFYEGFGTTGVPRPIVTWLLRSFPDQVGPGFRHLGMIEDPTSPADLPLGMAPGARMGNVDTLAFTCASCHFGRLPDGRYAVGAANHQYRYGAQNLMMVLMPMLVVPGADPAAHDPDALAIVQPLRDRMAANPQIRTSLLLALLPLILGGGATLPPFDAMSEHLYASWREGTMDFFIQPLPFDDEVHTISKISALWGIPTEEERAARAMPSAQLGWTGGTATLLNFARSFVHLGGGDQSQWPDASLLPLVEYVYSLRAPANPAPPPAAQVAAGAALFRSEGCIGCHDGPRGSGRELFDYDEIGTDQAMKWWVDGDLDGVPDHDIRFEDGDLVTHQLKSPRLVGLWTMRRFLHNGSVDSLDDLLCLNGPRGTITELAYGDGGHTFGCELPAADRRALIAYLLSN